MIELDCFSSRVRTNTRADRQDLNPLLAERSPLLDLTNVTEGEHVLTVVAEGAVTRYLLSRERQDEQLAEPVPLKVATAFVVKR